MHLSDTEEFISCQLVDLALAEGEAPKEVQVLIAGEFRHPNTGEKVRITPEDLRQFKANFDANVRKIDLAFNYEHRRSPAHGTKAAGWFKSLTLKNGDTELWAVPEWTPDAEAAIKAKEFRYLSAEVSFDYMDNMTGKKFKNVLTGAALTNTPVIKGMAALEAAETEPSTKENPMDLAELKATLEREHKIDLAELQRKAGRVDQAEAKNQELSEALSTEKEKTQKLEGEKKELAERAETAEKAQADVKFQALIEQGMKDGKLTKNFAEGKFKELYEKNGLEFAEEMLKDMPKVVPTDGPEGHGGSSPTEGSGATKKSPDAELAEKADKLATEKGIEVAEAVNQVLAQNPELAKRYDQLGRD